MKTIEDWMRKLGWEFYQTGPQEGMWMLADGDRFVAHQGDDLWERHRKFAETQIEKRSD